MAKRNMSELEAEQSSSEETLEGVTNVSTKPFSCITSCQRLKQKTVGEWSSIGEITGIVLLSDGQAVICQPSEGRLRILGKDMETKLILNMKRHINYRENRIDSMAIALFDRKRVAVAMSCTWERTEEEQEEMAFINIVSVSPKVKLGPEIKLKYQCEKIICFNNKIYCYSPDLRISTMIYCPGIEILSQTGNVLKTIQLFDKVSCFCPSKDGNIIYFGRRLVGDRTATFLKCVTDDNTELFHYPTLLKPKFGVSDTLGNIIILNSSRDVDLLNPDGSKNRVLLDQSDIGEAEITSLCYNDDNNTLLLAVLYDQRPQMLLYQLQ